MEERRNAPSCSDGEEDRISKLQDELIHHVLSFINTKYAVQTSVLSKRWIDVWKSLPFLNFDRSLFPHDNTKMFIDFVDMVFIFRDDTIDIERFSVDWDKFTNEDNSVVATNVNRWCLNAVKRNVEEVSVVIFGCQDLAYEIPYRLLNCKSLTKLEMRMSSEAAYAKILLPRSMDLPHLKELLLEGFSISDVDLSAKLLSSCRVLEDLGLVDCNIQTDNQRHLTVHCASLKKFSYTHWTRRTLPQNDRMAKIIKLCAPNLEEFGCRSFLTQDYILENSSPLSRVAFYMDIEEENDESADTYSNLPLERKEVYAKRLMQFIGAVYMVKYMGLSPGFLEVFSQAHFILDCQPPRLCNLETLDLEIWSTRDCLRAVAFLLKISPNITTMYLELKESNFADVGDDWEAGFSVSGMLSRLDYVQVEEVEGCDTELKLLTFLLKNAKVLEKLAVYFRSSVGSPDRVRQVEQFKDKLRAVSAASSSVKLGFY